MTDTDRKTGRLLGAVAAAALAAALVPAGPASADHPSPRAALDFGEACANAPEDAFTDDDTSDHEVAIDCIVFYEITTGRTATSYAPASAVRRDQMATFIANLIDYAANTGTGEPLPTAPPGNPFPCTSNRALALTTTNAHYDNIRRLAAAGLVKGGVEGNAEDCYGPSLGVRRDQMATYLVESVEHSTGADLASTTDYFVDDDTSVHEDNINAGASAGLISGRGQNAAGHNIYEPANRIRRDQMAAFLARSVQHLVDADVIAPRATGGGQVTMTSSTVEQGGTISGTITGGTVRSASVSGCGLSNQTIGPDESASQPGRQFTLTIPSSQPAGTCQLTFTITRTDDTTVTEVETITVTARSTRATTRPELQAADIVSTSVATAPAPGTVVRYTFDEPVTGPVGALNLFHVYTASGVDQGPPTSAQRDPADSRSILARFAGITTQAAAEQLAVATVDIGAVTDAQGQANPEGVDAAGLGRAPTSAAGTTTAPDLRSVGGYAAAQDDPLTVPNEATTTDAVSFVFDQPAFPVGTGGYSLVLTNGTVVQCTGPAPGATAPAGQGVPGGAGTATITVRCARATTGTFADQPLSSTNVARGIVQQGTVSSTAAGAGVAVPTGTNPLQASDTPDLATTGPDLVSAELRPGATAGARDSVLFRFDEAVVSVLAPATAFFVYESNGTQTQSLAGFGCTGAVCEADFAPGTAVENAVGGGVTAGSVVSATTAPNRDDEVGITNTTTPGTPGRTTGPDLTAVALAVTARDSATNQPTAYAAIYTFDEALASVAAASDFHLFTADGSLLVATACSVGTAANTGATTVRCTAYNTAAAATPNSTAPSGIVTAVHVAMSAVLGTVDDTAVAAADGGPGNPEGAAITTGGTGTRTD